MPIKSQWRSYIDVHLFIVRCKIVSLSSRGRQPLRIVFRLIFAKAGNCEYRLPPMGSRTAYSHRLAKRICWRTARSASAIAAGYRARGQARPEEHMPFDNRSGSPCLNRCLAPLRSPAPIAHAAKFAKTSTANLPEYLPASLRWRLVSLRLPDSECSATGCASSARTPNSR